MSMSNELEVLKNELGILDEKRSRLDAERVRIQDRISRLEAKREAQKNLDAARLAAIRKLWARYWGDTDNSEAEDRLQKYLANEPHILKIWLEHDVATCLKKTGLAPADVKTMKDMVEDCNIDFDKCYRDAETRLDFAGALKGVRRGSDLAERVGYGFGSDDILALLGLHRKNRFRKKIEDLLTCCNFHYECGMLSQSDYDKLEAELKQELRGQGQAAAV